MTRTAVRTVVDDGETYEALMFACPGCAATRDGYEGVNLLPVTGDGSKRPTWTFDGDLEKPTVSPSILTKGNWDGVPYVCHSFLRAGQFEFLNDCTHALAGQTVDVPALPTWAAQEAQ